jgi:hypothetical protein
MKIDLESKIQQAETSLKRKLDWIGRYDGRVAFVAGVSIAMLGVLANASAHIVTWHWYLSLIFGLAALFLSLNLVMIYRSQYPKTEARNASLAFFGTIADLKIDEFSKRFKQRTDEEYLDDLLHQIHINAELLKKKFSNLKLSLQLLATAILPWLLAIYYSKLYLK